MKGASHWRFVKYPNLFKTAIPALSPLSKYPRWDATGLLLTRDLAGYRDIDQCR